MHSRIKMVRTAHPEGRTQESFAKYLGVSKDNIASYESGRRNPSDAFMNLLCQKCGVNIEWLRSGCGDPYIEKTDEELIAKFFGEVEALDADSFTFRFIKMLASMNSEQRKLFEEMGQMLLDQAKKDE